MTLAECQNRDCWPTFFGGCCYSLDLENALDEGLKVDETIQAAIDAVPKCVRKQELLASIGLARSLGYQVPEFNQEEM